MSKENRIAAQATVDRDLWSQVKIQSFLQRKTTGEILEAAIKCYLKTLPHHMRDPEDTTQDED